MYEQIKKQKDEGKAIDIKQIVADLLHENLATDVTSSGKWSFTIIKTYLSYFFIFIGGVGCDNMTCILILFDNDQL